MILRPFWIGQNSSPDAFPELASALDEPNGLLAAGGDLNPERLLAAYRRGIFPWYDEGQPILWWSPDPRAVLFPDEIRISRSLGKTIRRGEFRVAQDQAFQRVISACATIPRGHEGTWITPEMMQAYLHLHLLRWAHSIECWHGDELAGGLYGVAIGRVFFGESMFSHRRDASKVALAYLASMGFELIDCQVQSAHLTRMGATNIPRSEFTAHLDKLCDQPMKGDGFYNRGAGAVR